MAMEGISMRQFEVVPSTHQLRCGRYCDICGNSMDQEEEITEEVLEVTGIYSEISVPAGEDPRLLRSSFTETHGQISERGTLGPC